MKEAITHVENEDELTSSVERHGMPIVLACCLALLCRAPDSSNTLAHPILVGCRAGGTVGEEPSITYLASGTLHAVESNEYCQPLLAQRTQMVLSATS